LAQCHAAENAQAGELGVVRAVDPHYARTEAPHGGSSDLQLGPIHKASQPAIMLLTLTARDNMSKPRRRVGSPAGRLAGNPAEEAAWTERSGYRYRAAARSRADAGRRTKTK
jgi:hypothetical protein